MKQIRKRLTYANVMSSIAVFVVLGGAAVAATQLPKNSVGAKQLKKNAVKTSKIAKSAVNGAKIADGAVTATEIADGAVTTAKLADNAATGAKVDEATLGEVPSAKNATTLDNIGSGAFPRAASSSIVNNALVGVSGTARELDITAPQAGFLLVVASSDVFGSVADTYNCVINVDGTTFESSRRESEFGAAAGDSEEDCGTNLLAPVAAGKHNVKFNFGSIGTETTVDETELDVIFVALAG